jgi:hypothetical protein
MYNKYMTATSHALVSGAIVAAIPDPLVSLPLVFASHFIMDAVPHWDFGTNWRDRSKSETGLIAILDTIVGFTVTYFVFGGKVELPLLMLAMTLGNLPDWLEAPYYIFFAKQNKKTLSEGASFWERLTYRIYKMENVFHTKAQFPFGLVTQVATVAFFLLLLRRP